MLQFKMEKELLNKEEMKKENNININMKMRVSKEKMSFTTRKKN